MDSSSSPNSPKITGKSSRKRDREGLTESENLTNRRSATPVVQAVADSTTNLPPDKRPKVAVSTNSISEEEVKRYLLRRPITSKDLVRKFINKKTDMERNRIVEVLHQIIERLKNVEKQTVKGKLYLSLKKI